MPNPLSEYPAYAQDGNALDPDAEATRRIIATNPIGTQYVTSMQAQAPLSADQSDNFVSWLDQRAPNWRVALGFGTAEAPKFKTMTEFTNLLNTLRIDPAAGARPATLSLEATQPWASADMPALRTHVPVLTLPQAFRQGGLTTAELSSREQALNQLMSRYYRNWE